MTEFEKKRNTDYDFPPPLYVGGKQKVTSKSYSQVLQWFHWVRQKKTWDQAKTYCESMGGKLFSDIDGTEDQLNWLVTKMGENHWVGIYRKTDGASDWFTTEDELLESSLLNWGVNQGLSRSFMPTKLPC